MTVEFDVKMTPGILYDYMLRHTYTGTSGLVGNCIGALMVVLFFYNGNVLALIGGLLILVYTPWTLFLKSRQQMLRNPSFKEPLHYVMGEEGIQVSQGEEIMLLEWDKFSKAISTRHSIIVYTSSVNASIFPKKELGDQITDIIAMISTHMPPGKVKIRC